MMELKVPYIDLSTHEHEATFGALVSILLKSRLQMQLETNQGFYDEDVNAYVAGVLFEYLDPQYQASVRQYLFDRDSDVFLSATREDSAYRAYWVYKVNADDRLMDLGVFRPHREGHAVVLARMKRYYGFAAEYHQRRCGRGTAVSDILGKLARWTERYLSILHQARREYLHFIEALTDEEVREFQQGLTREARAASLKAKQDEFLDVYSRWQRTSDPKVKARLLALVDELRRLNPRFLGPLSIFNSH